MGVSGELPREDGKQVVQTSSDREEPEEDGGPGWSIGSCCGRLGRNRCRVGSGTVLLTLGASHRVG